MTSFKRVERRSTSTTVTTSVDDGAPETARYTVHVTWYRVSGAEAVAPYPNATDLLYVPTSVVVEQYEGDALPSVRVRGALRLDDGTTSPNARDINLYNALGENWPEWLVQIVADAAAEVSA